MSSMETDEQSVVLPSSTTSGLSLSLSVYFLSETINDINVQLVQTSPADPEHLRTLDKVKASGSVPFTFRHVPFLLRARHLSLTEE